MSALIHPHPAALLQSAETQARGVALINKALERMRRSPALASLPQPLIFSGLLSAVVVAALQLTWLGAVEGFLLIWLENWVLTWALAFPIAYVAGPALIRLARFVSSASAAPQSGGGLGFVDIASASARATNRYGFSVLRNLQVREDFYRP